MLKQQEDPELNEEINQQVEQPSATFKLSQQSQRLKEFLNNNEYEDDVDKSPA